MNFFAEEKWLLVVIGAGIFILAFWMTIEAVIAFFSVSSGGSVATVEPEEQV
jgi:hypothetical protein